MHVKPASIAADGYVLGTAAVIWLVTTAWLLERITASLYESALALIKIAATTTGGG
jgi:hypothetical protein